MNSSIGPKVNEATKKSAQKDEENAPFEISMMHKRKIKRKTNSMSSIGS